MEQLAKDYGDRVHFLFVYTREAHPGELIPHHTSFEQKVSQAQMLRDRGMNRQMVIDNLNGDIHRLYIGLSNMSWIIDHTGRVAYKASWTDSADIRTALEETVTIREHKASEGMVNEFYREMVGLRLVRPEGPGMLGGEKAVEDFKKGNAAFAVAQKAAGN